jgi:hypothetical protein
MRLSNLREMGCSFHWAYYESLLRSVTYINHVLIWIYLNKVIDCFAKYFKGVFLYFPPTPQYQIQSFALFLSAAVSQSSCVAFQSLM